MMSYQSAQTQTHTVCACSLMSECNQTAKELAGLEAKPRRTETLKPPLRHPNGEMVLDVTVTDGPSFYTDCADIYMKNYTT